MTRDEYERRKQRLDEQLRAGVELLEAAHRAQMRALDLVWMVAAEEDVDPSWLGGPAATATAAATPAVPAPAPPAPPEPPRWRKGMAEIADDVRAALERCPPTFDRNDVCRALGYEPDRRTLYKVLRGMVAAGDLTVEASGRGRQPSHYRKS